METLWQKGSLTQAVARIEAESYPPSDAGLLYRDEPQLEEAGKQMRTFLEAGRLVSAASHSMNLLELRLQALRRAGHSGAAALFRAEGELYQGLYRAGENALTVMVQRNNKHHPILQAEAARLLWESRAFAHGDADAASLKLAREQYRLAARGRGPEAMWACYGLMRLAVACNEDVRQAAAEVTRRFPRSVVAEEARRFLSAMNTSDPPVLCTHMASPQDTLAVRVFPRRGFVMGSFGDQCYNFTQAAWVDGMGVFINEDRIEGRQWHSRSLVWPGYSFRPGVCVVDYYADRQFVLRRTFIVQGEVPNEAN
jgi:hypothetical protein